MRVASRDAAAVAQELRALLDRGGFLVVPTESSYALAADPVSRAGVDAVFAFKRRPPGKPLPVVAAERRDLGRLGARLDDPMLDRLASLWPAALTLVAPLDREIAASAGERTLGVRVPARSDLRQLLAAVGRPLTATSANRSGEPPILDPDELAAELAGSPAVLIDAGRLTGGPPSTLVAVDRGRLRILRLGAYSVDRLAAEISAAAVEISEEPEPVTPAVPRV